MEKADYIHEVPLFLPHMNIVAALCDIHTHIVPYVTRIEKPIALHTPGLRTEVIST